MWHDCNNDLVHFIVGIYYRTYYVQHSIFIILSTSYLNHLQIKYPLQFQQLQSDSYFQSMS